MLSCGKIKKKNELMYAMLIISLMFPFIFIQSKKKKRNGKKHCIYFHETKIFFYVTGNKYLFYIYFLIIKKMKRRFAMFPFENKIKSSFFFFLEYIYLIKSTYVVKFTHVLISICTMCECLFVSRFYSSYLFLFGFIDSLLIVLWKDERLFFSSIYRKSGAWIALYGFHNGADRSGAERATNPAENGDANAGPATNGAATAERTTVGAAINGAAATAGATTGVAIA